MIDHVRVDVGHTLIFGTVARPFGHLCVSVLVLMFSIDAVQSAQVEEATSDVLSREKMSLRRSPTTSDL